MVHFTSLFLAIASLTMGFTKGFSPSGLTFVRSIEGSCTELGLTKVQEVKRTINNLNKDNFASSVAEIEPFLLNDAGATLYKKSMKRIKSAATSLGVDLDAAYAKDAKATAKRREKQDAFIQQKEAERLEAEAAEEESQDSAEEGTDAAVEEEDPELVAA